MLTFALALLLALHPPNVSAVHYRVTRVDPVEREFYGIGQSRPVVGVFSTVYKINGRRVSRREFWATLKPGDVLDAKVVPGAYYAKAVVAAVNLRRTHDHP